MQREHNAVFASCDQCCRDRGGVVHDDEVARREEQWEVAKRGAGRDRPGAFADEQSHFVPRQPARFRRLARLERRRQLEPNRRLRRV